MRGADERVSSRLRLDGKEEEVILATGPGWDALKIKFRGCLVGLALGDALGAPFEGAGPVDKKEVFAAAERRQILRYTDDTHMAIGVAESLMVWRGFDGSHLAGTFLRNFEREPWRGYGLGPPRVFQRIKLGTPWDRAAEEIYPGGSFGNGAAMRIALGGFSTTATLRSCGKWPFCRPRSPMPIPWGRKGPPCRRLPWLWP